MKEPCELGQCIANLARFGKVACAWEEAKPFRLSFNASKRSCEFTSLLVRRNVLGDVVAEAGHKAGGYVYSTNLGSVRGGPDAASLHDALEEADSQLEAAGYALLGKLALVECGVES